MNHQRSEGPAPEERAWSWTPVAKGETVGCVCGQEGCCSMITVLNREENVLEVYQANVFSHWSCIARIVLPDDLALCRKVRTDQVSAGPEDVE